MANNLRYLLEHFCLDGQKIDISSQLDEENANNIEKINTQTIPSINTRIDEIKDNEIPRIDRRIDVIKDTDIPSINQKINTINNTTIPSVQESVAAVDEKADRINESVAKNTRDIGTLSDNVTMQGNAINSINTEKIPSIENNVSANTDNINTIINTTIPDVRASVTAVDEKADRINESVAKNTRDIGTLSDNVTAQGNNINELSSKVNTNTDSINTINNTSIPHLQSEIDNLSGGGTGSVGELKEKVEKNTSDISALSGKVETNTADISTLNGKVDSNTTAISTINGTSIPNLQSEIDNLKTVQTWELISTKEVTKNDIKLTISIYSNGAIYYANLIYDFANITDIKLNLGYNFGINDIPLPTPDNTYFSGNAYFFAHEVGFNRIIKSGDQVNILLAMNSKPGFTSLLTTITSGVFYF